MFVRILFVPLESGSESRRTLTEIRRKSEAIKSCNVHTVETFRCSKLSLYGNHLQRAKDLTSRGGTPFCFLFLFFTSYSLLRFVHCLSCFLSFCFANVFVVSNSAKWVLIVCVCVCAPGEGREVPPVTPQRPKPVTKGRDTNINNRRVETETETKLECPIPFSRLWSVLYPLTFLPPTPSRDTFVKAGKVEHTHMELSIASWAYLLLRWHYVTLDWSLMQWEVAVWEIILYNLGYESLKGIAS